MRHVTSPVIGLLGVFWAASLNGCSATRTRFPEAAGPDVASVLSDVTTPFDVAEVTPPADVEALPDTPDTPDIPDATDVPSGPACTAVEPSGTTAGFARGVTYEVFVRSFQDSNGDGIGDLQGLTSRLDYLNDGDPASGSDLGVDRLWLMPISPSPSYHGYDVTDYGTVNPEYGTEADFDVLVDEAGKRGIEIVLDLVLNHTSTKHPWFVKGKRGDPFEERYVWRTEHPTGWGQPWEPAANVWHALGDRYYYGLFWEGMPDLNYGSAAVADDMIGYARAWAARGVRGFRLDAARYLVENGPGDAQADQPETHAFWRRLRSELGEDVLLLGEAWTALPVTRTYFGAGDELQQVFAFDRAIALRDGLRLGSAGAFTTSLCDEVSVPSPGGFASFVQNHDLDRLPTVLSGLTPAARDARLRLAATLLLMLPGSPTLYYGEELGLPNGSASGDLGKRLPMRWDDGPTHGFTTASSAWMADTADPSVRDVAAQLADEASLLAHYRELLTLRRERPSLREGAFRRLDVSSTGASVLAFERRRGDETTVIVANFGTAEAQDVVVAVGAQDGANAPAPTPLLGSPAAGLESEALTVAVIPAGAAVLYALSP
ncbi:MAG: DUF3459 domain-containing protein [Myxococcales bacterium]|nr:DUF3459 domain-containing protein [Myxococcales bacterium]